jgi:N-acetylmuramic acid 6-phosphate etherase
VSEAPVETERANPRTRDLDTLDVPSLVAVLAREQGEALRAVERASPAIARAVDAIVAALRGGGSLHYVGAGTSGRLGVLDAAECPPTFGVPGTLVVAHIAGGSAALTQAVEGAEDDAAAGAAEMATIGPRDVVVGVSASGGAPYVAAALARARERGAGTIAIANVADSPIARDVDVAIVLETGAEPIAGSTRLKAGTAQKLALNALSTAAMIRMGRVYDNLMVDVVATNAKLKRRALGLVRTLTGLDEVRAALVLARAGGNVKIAVVMSKREVSAERARVLLEESGGFLRPLL